MNKFKCKNSFNFATNDSSYTITTPESHQVTPPRDLDFIYIMRTDAASICGPLAEKISSEYKIPRSQVEEIIYPIYDCFMESLVHTLGKHFQHKGKTEIHLFDSDDIEAKRLTYVGQRTAISLDPIIANQQVPNVGISRGYLPGGRIEIGMIARPGYPDLPLQINELKTKLSPNEAIDIFEDDIFTGGSLTKIVDMLHSEGIQVARIIPGIQVGIAQALLDRGIDIEPVIKYILKEDQDIDLGDPRDFLVGADGLVISLDGQKCGRLPYIAPFVSPHARLSIPKDQEEAFSKEVLQLNIKFYKSIEECLSLPIKLKHMNAFSADALKTFIPCDQNSNMTDVINFILTNYRELEANCEWKMYLSAFKILDLPRNLILLDVNGTLIPSDSEDGFIEPEDLEELQKKIYQLSCYGFTVGLNSDSPLPQLKEFARKLGVPDTVMIAENGAIIAYRDKKVCLRTLENIDTIKSDIKSIANNFGLVQTTDVVACEFGGSKIKQGEWGFGANRTGTLSLFCLDRSFLSEVKEMVDTYAKNQVVNCDFSPEYGFFSIHSCENFRRGKAEILERLAKAGHQVVSIGDSLSDYADYNLPNRVVFVQDGLPDAILHQPHVSVSQFKGIGGVIETLNKILQTKGIDRTLKEERSYDI
jgi:hydroxymethylpyrimidine pyrophosphatase-like HAD family hydrolase